MSFAEILNDIHEEVEDANDLNFFYLATLSNYRIRDAEGAEKDELEKIMENVLSDKENLTRKLKEIEAMSKDILLETNDPAITSRVQEILSELPEPPRDDDLKVISLDSLTDELDVSSIDDADASLNESKVYQMSQFEEIIDLIESLKELETQIKQLEGEKSRSKQEMFEMRERGESTKSSQELQKYLFETINEFKADHQRQKKEIRNKIKNLLPNADGMLKENLMQALSRLHDDTVAQPSPEVIRTQTPVTSNRPLSGIPKIQTTPKPAVPITSGDPRVVREIERHKSKILRAENIRKFGTHQNMQRAETISKLPRIIPHSEVEERRKQHSQVLKMARSIGSVKKVAIRPSFHAPIVASGADIRAMEVNKAKLKTAASAQRSFLRKPKNVNDKTIVDEILGRDQNQIKANINGMSIVERERAEKEDVLKLINSVISQGPLFSAVEEAKTLNMKILALRQRLKTMFEWIRIVMATYRGASFLPDEPAYNRFIDSIIAHFNKTRNFSNFRSVLINFFKKMPYPKFRVFQAPNLRNFVPTPSSPSSNIPRPSTTPGRTPVSRFRTTTPVGRTKSQTGIQTKTPMLRRRINPSSPYQRRRLDLNQVPVKAKVQQQIQNLSQSNLQKSIREPTTMQKLEAFTNNFCKIFIGNKKNQRNSFDVWSKTFMDNLNPILDDLQSFYQSLPYPELQNFDRAHVEKSLNNLLTYLYNETRNKNINSLQCRDLIGTEMNKLIEGKHLKSLSTALGVFVEGVKELIKPYIHDVESQNSLDVPITPDMKRKRDESFLKQRGPTEGYFASFWESYIPLSMQPVFKKIIGFTPKLNELDVDDRKISAFIILLEHCAKIDLKVFQVLTIQADTPTKSNALRIVLNDFIEQVIHMIFNNDYRQFAIQIEEIRDLYKNLELQETLQAIESITFSKYTANLMLLDPYKFSPPDNEPLIHEAVRFIKDVRYMQQKYLWMILRGEFYGTIEQFGTGRLFEDEHLANTENEIVTEILRRIRINQPYEVKSRHSYPVNLLERDILYVACQLTNRDDDLSGDKIENMVISIAKRYQAREISENAALRSITQILQLMICIPIDFYKKFIYHEDNDYFHTNNFEDPTLNIQVRNYLMFDRKKKSLCSEDRATKGRQMNIISNEIDEFMQLHENNLDEMIIALQFDTNIDQIYKVLMYDNEVANNGNRLLGVPAAGVRSHDLTQGNIDNIHINVDKPPDTNAANAQILQMLDEIESKLDAQVAEINDLENLRIASNAIVHQLHPNALRRKNFWQSRGCEMPCWFPGIYTLFPDSLLSRPVKSSSMASISDLLLHAWRTMVPPISRATLLL